MSKTKPQPRREIRCYLCGHRFEVSSRTMSVPCPHCNKALKVEDVHIKSYLPVNDLQTCGKITIAKNGRVVAKVIRGADGIECEGALEGALESDGVIALGPKASWKGKSLQGRTLNISDGAQLVGHVKVPYFRPEPVQEKREAAIAGSGARSASKAAKAVPAKSAGEPAPSLNGQTAEYDDGP